MNPHQVSQSVNAALVKQMRRTRPVEGYDTELSEEIRRLYEGDADHAPAFRFVSPPYVERLRYYAQGEHSNLAQLVAEGALEPETANLFARYFGQGAPEDVTLYAHQAEAARAIAARKNVMVCTGTGSGKTESFLIPVINGIIKERKECKERNIAYTPGVRAMILYPMNALVNDQLLRLRRLLKLAGDTVDYAGDITFGYYTGEFDSQPSGASRWVKRLKDDKTGEAYFSSPEEASRCDHAYLSEDETADNEYVKRSWWTDHVHGPADILITNYSMLERLLLDPDKSAIFSPEPQTWKYIVLDEAHTYTGSLGTEISWLLRRLIDRVSEGGITAQDNGEAQRRIQFLATSATISTGEDAEQQALDFAQDIFRCRDRRTQDECPEANGNFIVLQGEHYRADWESDDARQRPGGTYARLLAEEGIDLGEYLAGSHLEQLRPIESSLFAQTKWLHQAQSWLGRFDYLEQFLKRENPTEAALGDLIALSTCLEALGMEDQDISLRRNSSLDSLDSLQSLLLFYQGQEPEAFRQKLRNISGERLNSAVEARKSSILKFCEQKEDVVKLRPLSLLPILAQLLLSLQEEYNKAEDLDVEVARWKFEWTNAFTELLKRGAEQVRVMRERIRGMRSRIAEKWADLLNTKAEERSAKALITDYILTHRELGVMAELLKAGHAKEEDLCRECFGDETAEFEAFIQLLTLTQDEALPNKAPLMDLRYHQLVNRIEGAAVWFDEQNHLHLVLNEEAENSALRTDDGQEYQLYELGQCYNCGHPYLMLYASGAMVAGKMPAMGETVYRFGGAGLGLHAFARCCEGEKAEYWLDAQRRKLYDHEATGGLIPLRLHAAASQTEAQKTAQNAATSNIGECPHCGSSSQTSTTYGIIGPYNTGSDFSRTTVIDSMVKLADPEFGIDPRKHPQQGRKLLTFSDSRSQAAAIPVEYENSTEERHVLRLLMECVQELEETDPRKALNKLVEFCTGKSRDEKSDVPEKYDVSKDKDLNGLFVIRTIPNFPPEHAAPLEESLAKRLANSPLLLMPGFTGRLRRAGGDYLLQKEFTKNGENGAQETEDFSEGVAALLTMFSLLRSPGRYCAVKGPEAPLRVYSWKHESSKENSSDWKRFKDFCRDDDAAEKAFQAVYTDIFLSVKASDRVKASYGGFGQADRWNDDTAKSADGKGLYCRKNETYGKKEEAVLSLIRDSLQEPTNRKAAAFLLDYLRNSILIDGKIDLYDVRLKLTPAGRAMLERDPNLVTVFYEADEHSAQLAKETKRLYQQKFTEGTINILSCTTTFEMGVDVGSLNCVLLCDMPPSVASYRQRAGRAGRRAGSSAYVLTLATGRAHDVHFSQHPEDMFFGEVTPPVIYSHNKSFRAKHLRAVALQLFLSSLKSGNKQKLWKLSGHFFLNTGEGDKQRLSCISDLPAWVEEHRDEVQERCRAIAGDSLDYSVADDLCLQITGLSNGLDRYKNRLPNFDETPSYLELSGPFLPNPDNKGSYNEADPWKASAARRYELEILTAGGGKIPADIMDSSKGSYCRRMANAQTVDVLARFRVLSRYGFPCEVITLRLAGKDESRLGKVDLSRDIKQGLYEYAPGQVVLANKRKYESKSPIWLGSYRGKGKKEQLDIEEDKQFLACTQKQCLCVMYDEGDDELPKCPQCGAAMQRMTASRPDAFQAEPSQKANAVPLNVHPPRRCCYIGHRSETWDIDGTRTQASSSDSREIIYLNILSKDFKRGDENIDALYYAFRTDIVMLSLNPKASPLPDNPCWDSDVHRSRAWRSATQAIVKALAKVLHVSPMDIGALTTEIDKIPHIVLFDNTASGSGAMLRLIKGKTKEEAQQQGNSCVELTKRILEEALALCKSCECFSLRDAHQGIVMTHHDCLMAREESSRVEAVQEYHSCYKCLKSYSNQTEHDILDAHDAAFILQHMLGSDESPEACSPQPQPPAEPFPKPEVEHPVSPLPPCPSPADQASSGREKPRATREQLQFVRDLKLRRLGPFPACRVIRNGKETEMRAIYASKTHIYLSLPGPECNAEKFEFRDLILD